SSPSPLSLHDALPIFLPVVGDESCIVNADIPRVAGAVDGINIKLAKCGSLREALRMIGTARAHGMLVMVGCMIESSLGITAAARSEEHTSELQSLRHL